MNWLVNHGYDLVTVLAATGILLAGLIDDLRSRKFHNWLFLVCCAVAIVACALANGPMGILSTGILGFVAGIAILLPLVLGGVIGAGDMKLLAAFGIVAGWNAVISVAVFGLIWGAAFGVLRTVINGQGRMLFENMLTIVTFKERKNLELHRMPFTVAIFMGWLTHLVQRGSIV